MTVSTLRGLASRSSSVGDELDDGAVLVLDLLAFQCRQASQLHLEDRVRLRLGQVEAAHERRPGGIGVGRGADRGDHAVEVVERDLQPLEDVGALLRPGEVELGPPPHDLAPEADVVLEHPLEAKRDRLPVDEGEHVGAEAGLELGVLEELLHDGVRRPVALHARRRSACRPCRFRRECR